MSGPKHLWSGNWEQDSAAVSDERASRPVKAADPEPTVAATAPGPRARSRRRPTVAVSAARPRRGLRPRALSLGLAALLALAAGAYGLTALLGSDARPASNIARPPSGSPTATIPFVPPASATPSTPSPPPASAVPPATATTTIPPRPVNWLGMEIQTVAPGAAVIDTVAAGSAGALAGLQPGEVITEINRHPIHGTGDIVPAISGLRSGDLVEMQVSHGSGFRQMQIPLAAPPSAYP